MRTEIGSGTYDRFSQKRGTSNRNIYTYSCTKKLRRKILSSWAFREFSRTRLKIKSEGRAFQTDF